MAALGLIFALSAPGYGLWPIAWVVLIPALHWVRKMDRPVDVALGGFWFGAMYHALYFIWFWDLHPLTWLGFSEWQSWLVTGAGWLLLVAEGGLLLAALMLAFQWLNRFRNVWLSLLLFPALWVLGFSLQNFSPLTLPWTLIEYSQAPVTTARAIAALLGGSGLAYGMVFHNVFWEAWLSGRLPKRDIGQRAGMLPSGWLLALVTPTLFFIGSLLPEQRTPLAWPVPVAAVQGNLPIEIVRSSALLTPSVVGRAYLAPLQAASLPVNTLVVLPEEGAVPGWVQAEHPFDNPVMASLQGIARQKQADIAVGISLAEGPRSYNAIALIRHDHARVQYYRKRKLVPFGEYVPFGAGPGLSALLADLHVDYAPGFDAGRRADLLETSRLRIGGLVCFELIDSDPLGRGLAGESARRGATLLVDVSNLGWFHENRWMEAQFLAIARMRAAETGLPLILASNTGISAVLSPSGRILARSHRQRAGRPHPQVIFYDGRRPF